MRLRHEATPELPFDVRPSTDDWAVLLASNPNVLVVGDDMATETALQSLAPYLREPIRWYDAGAPAGSPAGKSRTLVVRRAHQMGVHEQLALLQTLDSSEERMQVVTVAAEPLFPLVVQGSFLDLLFYRLNVLSLEVALNDPFNTAPGRHRTAGV